jgi:hypothetical protein
VSGYRCGFCDRTFMQDEAQPTCASCPLRGGCQLVRCPHCGYENPTEPAWLSRVRGWFATAEARSAGYDTAGNHHDDAEAASCR